MPKALFRFYGELNDFLPPEHRQTPIVHRFDLSAPVKDVIEGLGVPHPEVDLILANGQSVDFTYSVQDGDRVSVYPVFESLDITPLLRLRPRPLRRPRFLLDAHLGRLARYLRMLGFDALYRNDCADHELAALSARERRILLTRDTGLLKHGIVTHGYWLRSTEARRQLVEVVRRFDLWRQMAPFTRCMRCNAPLAPAPAEAVASAPPEARRRHRRFWRCPDCGRLYWQGSHYQRMQSWIGALGLTPGANFEEGLG